MNVDLLFLWSKNVSQDYIVIFHKEKHNKNDEYNRDWIF